MQEPRGHSAMSGAILQPPLLPDADWGVLFIEVSGLPADVRARDDRRVRPCSWRPGSVPVTEPETTIRLDTPAGLVEARVAVADGPRPRRDAAQRAELRRGPRPEVEVPGSAG
jgi:proline racemase